MKTLLWRLCEKIISLALASLLALAGLPLGVLIFNTGAPAPLHLSVPEVKTVEMQPGDYYVSTDGSDTNPGSVSRPFATIERARDEIRRIKAASGLPSGGVTVCVEAGEYRVKSLLFDRRDSGSEGSPVLYRAYGDGPVVLNGGITLGSGAFRPVSGAAKDRLRFPAACSVLETDLTACGLTAADWGKLYAIGAFNTAYKYDGDTTGPDRCELFFNDARMTLARYPNGDAYLKTGEIIDLGDCAEYPPQNYNPAWAELRNPRGGTFKTDRTANSRIRKWKTLDDVWMFGYFYWDWADASTPVASVDTVHSTVTAGQASLYAYKEGAPYFFYNVFEELDSPGEWYLDRTTGMLYLYPPGGMDNADIELSVSTESIIKTEGADYICFEGFEIKGTRGDAVNISGNGCALNNCVISNCAGSAVIVSGTGNTVRGNEIKKMGKGGIKLSGGDRTTLTHGDNIADNNHIHDYGEIYKTYQAGVTLNGVGNICSHNEIHDAPHLAIIYGGNDQLIEYNYIYDVVKQSSDAGAIYAGRDWTAYGDVVRYNCIRDIGSGDFRPDGIYFDDALSGQSAYGNILVNIPKNGFMLGGGRDLYVCNNIIINAGTAIRYDDRAREGVVSNGWFRGHVSSLDGGLWKYLLDSPYQTELWKSRYPQLSLVTHDFSDVDNPYFAPNPAFSLIKNNIIADRSGNIGSISEASYRFSTVENNPAWLLIFNPGFADFKNGDYRLKDDAPVYQKLDGFEQIPFEKIGRY